MTSGRHAVTDWPAPLKVKEHGLGEAVREFVSETEETHSEAAAYARLRALARQPSRRLARYLPRVVAGLGMVLLVAVSGTAIYRRAGHAPGTGAAARPPAGNEYRPADQAAPTHPTAQPSPKAQVRVPLTAAAVRLAGTPVVLPPGRIDLVGQATIVLEPDAVASARTQADNTEILLKKGRIDLDVLPRPPAHGFSVRAGRYRFAVVGTAFTVSQTRSRLELVVREGAVAVWRNDARLATVRAGQSWGTEIASEPSTGTAADATEIDSPNPTQPNRPTATTTGALPPVLVPPPARAPSDQPPTFAPSPVAPAPEGVLPKPAATAPHTAGISCGDLAASRQPHAALTCYQEKARQNGLAGETSQYELARLLRDSFDDPQRALAAFQEQRARFPSGALRIEADLSIIEILPRLGRHSEALGETERFLAARPTSERRGEIHLLRGNIFREGLHDLRQAEREYALGAESSGRSGDDCRFLHAVCVEALGRQEEARREYRAYLLHRGGAHTSEAKKRLDGSRP
jgi:hypothetical protein